MLCRSHRRSITLLVYVLLAVLLLVPIVGAGHAAPQSDDTAAKSEAVYSKGPGPLAATVAVDCDDTACPSPHIAGLDKCVQRADFCVYYTTDSVTEAEAEWAADQVQAYWDRFTGLGFRAPKTIGSRMEVYLEDITNDCNGSAGWSHNRMTTWAGCWDSGDDVVQFILGHELTHRMQYAYDFAQAGEPPPTRPIQTKFLKEGTARATQDNWFTNIDHIAAGAHGTTYCTEAASYLASTNSNLSTMWYASCVWWKWAMEQYGSILTEPERGVDFVEAVLDQNTAGRSGLAAVNGALTALGTGVDFDESFRKFAVAVYTKGLNTASLPDDSYRILDEDEPGSPGDCGTPTVADLGPVQVGTDRQWNNQDVSTYGARYYAADIGPTCPVVSASFHKDSGPAFYHIVTQTGNNFTKHVQGSGTDWTQSFLNDGLTRIVAVAGSLNGSTNNVDITLSCADPVVDIKQPNSGAPAHVQGNTKFLAQVLVTNGTATGPVVDGLTQSDFSARVGGVLASVTGGGFVQEQYWLVIRAPAGLAAGTHELEVSIEEPGTSTVLDSDTEFNAINYTTDLVDHVLVIDRSGSMGWPIEPDNSKLTAAKEAADFYVDITRNNDGLAVVAYNHDVDPSPFDMQSVNATVRTDASNYINNWTPPGGIFPSGATSIGDGLAEAARQRTVESSTGNPLCSFVLLSDGMENAERKWDSGGDPVITEVQATGCPVTSIAFGPASNETLMQDIATETGGLSFYNDVYVSAPAEGTDATSPAEMNLDLSDTYEYAQGESEGRQRVASDSGELGWRQVETHTIPIDSSMTEALFAIKWYGNLGYDDLDIILEKPDGTRVTPKQCPYTFINNASGYLGWRVPNSCAQLNSLDVGLWKMIVWHSGYGTEAEIQQGGVHYRALVSGQSDLTLHLLLPDRLGGVWRTGQRFPIVAFLTDSGPVPGQALQVAVKAPPCAGLPFRQTMLSLFDDGEHGDGAADDGVYGNWYTRLNCSQKSVPPDETGAKNPEPEDEGGYQVQLVAKGTAFQREAKGAFAVYAGEDANSNGLPDPWEKENGVSDPNKDPDLDFLLNGDEYLFGTDPNNSDTDGGGENDGSEVDLGQDPLDPSDDEIEAPDFLNATPLTGKVRLTYDIKGEYVKAELWRAPGPAGPWNLRVSELPLGGVYEDPATNEETFYYRLIGQDDGFLAAGSGAVDAAGHRTAVIDSGSVTPSEDPVPPEAKVLVNGGAASTRDPKVVLSFIPYEYEDGDPDGFGDIVEMKLSNDPSFDGVGWVAFDQGVPWRMEGFPGENAFVYARFKDDFGNESAGTEVGAILYNPYPVFVPTIMRNP